MDIWKYLEIAGVAVGLLYLYFEYKASVWLWLTGIIMPALYIFVYYESGFYADMGINVYYLFAGFYGWAAWLGHRRRKSVGGGNGEAGTGLQDAFGAPDGHAFGETGGMGAPVLALETASDLNLEFAAAETGARNAFGGTGAAVLAPETASDLEFTAGGRGVRNAFGAPDGQDGLGAPGAQEAFGGTDAPVLAPETASDLEFAAGGRGVRNAFGGTDAQEAFGGTGGHDAFGGTGAPVLALETASELTPEVAYALGAGADLGAAPASKTYLSAASGLTAEAAPGSGASFAPGHAAITTPAPRASIAGASEAAAMAARIEDAMPITRTPARFWLPLALIVVAFFAVISYILINFTDSTVPLGDSFTTALSVVALWMLARKYVEQWLVWIVVDVICSGLYFYKGLYPTGALFALYSVIAVFGYFKWLKMMKNG